MSYHRPHNPHALVAGDYVGGRGVGRVPGLIAPVLGDGCGPVQLGNYAGLAGDAEKQALKSAKFRASVPQSVMDKFDSQLAAALRPASGAIDALSSVLDAGQRSRLKNRPVTFLFDLFDPIEEIIFGAIARTNASSGKFSRDFFGTRVDMRKVQPADSKVNADTLNLVRRMRCVQQFMVLVMQDPARFGFELTAGVAAAGLATGTTPFGKGTDQTQVARSQDEAAATASGPEMFASNSVFDAPPKGAVFVRNENANVAVYRRTDGLLVLVRRGTSHSVGGLGAVLPLTGAEVPEITLAWLITDVTSFVGVPWLGVWISSIVAAGTAVATGVITANATVVAITAGRIDPAKTVWNMIIRDPVTGTPSDKPVTKPATPTVRPTTQPVQPAPVQASTSVSPVVVVGGIAAVTMLVLALRKRRK